MRYLALALGAGLLVACTPAAHQDGFVDMGPMPVVAAVYDSGPLQRDAEWLSVWFTEEMASAIESNANGPEAERLDFDFRSWAIDPEVEDIRYAVGEHSTNSRAEITTRFGYEGLPGGMQLTWDMCRREDRTWRIADIAAIDVGDETTPGSGEAITLRALLGMEPLAEGAACV